MHPQASTKRNSYSWGIATLGRLSSRTTHHVNGPRTVRWGTQRILVAHRLGCRAYEPSACGYGKAVAVRVLHGRLPEENPESAMQFASQGLQCDETRSDSQMPAFKEPVGLLRWDSKRPDGIMILPWSKSKPLAWNVTVPDSDVSNTAMETGSAASVPVTNKNKYSQLLNARFQSIIHRDRRYMAPLDSCVGPEAGKLRDRRHRRIQEDHVPVPAISYLSLCKGVTQSRFRARSQQDSLILTSISVWSLCASRRK